MKLEIAKVAEILGCPVPKSIDPQVLVDTALLSFDTRKLRRGDIFIAIKTDKQDGAKYIGDALEKGAALILSETNPESLDRVLIVPDTLKALQQLGRYVRSQYKGFVIGITGSSGKTTSKELVAHMLNAFAKTFCGEGSFNNHLGTPYNLCRLDLNAAYAVFEMGMDHAGEVSALVDMIQPHLAAVTNVFPMHIEYFKEFRDIASAKAEIFEKVIPFNGRTVAVINADTSFADTVLIPEAKRHGIGEILTFGQKGQVKLRKFSLTPDCKTEIEIEVAGKSFRHRDLGLGDRFAYNATFAAAVAHALGLDIEKALQAIEDFAPLKGRGKISSISLGKGVDITLIDDSYNGQPAAMRYAIGTLNAIPKGKARKIALVGRMGELGDHAETEHRSVGKVLAETDVDVIIGVGAETRLVLEEVPDGKTKIFKENINGLFEELTSSILRSGDIILIKGAHYSSRVFEIADKLLAL